MSLTCKVPNFITLGAAAVPPKSPANIIFPFTLVVASKTEFEMVVGSANAFFTNAVVATAVLLSVVVIVDATTFVPKLTAPVNVGEAKGAFKSKAVCVKVDIGFAKSVVLFTLFNSKLALAFIAFVAPVPPFANATIPLTLVAVPFTVPDNVPTKVLPVTTTPLKFPIKVFAVITLPAKLPFASLITFALGVLLEVEAAVKLTDV